MVPLRPTSAICINQFTSGLHGSRSLPGWWHLLRIDSELSKYCSWVGNTLIWSRGRYPLNKAISALYKWNLGRRSTGEARYSSPSKTIKGALVIPHHGIKTFQLGAYPVVKIATQRWVPKGSSRMVVCHDYRR